MNKDCALLLIDIQNGFMPGGSLPVEQGDEIVPFVNNIIGDYSLVVASQDWHPENHGSFAANHEGKNPFEVIDLYGLEQVLWPIHCVQGTDSAEFHASLNTNPIAAIFRKGMDAKVDSYSAFYDNGHRHDTGLAHYLRAHDIKHIHVAGLAADYCVYYSIKDALDEGFNVSLLAEGTRAIDNAQHQAQLNTLAQNSRFSLIR